MGVGGKEHVFLRGFSIANFRSFGDEDQLFTGLRKINFLIGQNNAGKSNVFRALLTYFPESSHQREERRYDVELDKSTFSGSASVRVGMALELDDPVTGRIMERFRYHGPYEREAAVETLFPGGSPLWYWVESDLGAGKFHLTSYCAEKICKTFDNAQLENLFRWACHTGGGNRDTWKAEVPKQLYPFEHLKLLVELIPATRSTRGFSHPSLVGTQGGHFFNGIRERGGIGLIEEIFKLQNPKYDRPQDAKKFREINKFIQDVLGEESARVQVPHTKDIVQVELNGHMRPLETLGSGIEDIVIIAAHCTAIENALVCVEEPELHLHPSLQRKLIRYLRDYTSNQYLISTHSAHILDAVEASIYHIQQTKHGSVITGAVANGQRVAICEDLGYRASDLLQANCIIWVEGPSDRIYLNSWITASDSTLVEGIHYSIMFYGGRLLSRLSAASDEVGDFIKLRRLNQHMAILIDSDRRSQKDEINKTKRRIADEFAEAGGVAWVTAGREIENYVPAESLQAAMKTLDENFDRIAEVGQFSKQTTYVRKTEGGPEETVEVDKMKLAHAVASLANRFDHLDLRERITKLVDFIKASNP